MNIAHPGQSIRTWLTEIIQRWTQTVCLTDWRTSKAHTPDWCRGYWKTVVRRRGDSGSRKSRTEYCSTDALWRKCTASSTPRSLGIFWPTDTNYSCFAAPWSWKASRIPFRYIHRSVSTFKSLKAGFWVSECARDESKIIGHNIIAHERMFYPMLCSFKWWWQSEYSRTRSEKLWRRWVPPWPHCMLLMSYNQLGPASGPRKWTLKWDII